jgi:hypothetical protein
VKPPNWTRWAGVAAIVGGLMAILLTPPFATAYFLAFPGEDPLPFWFEWTEPRLEPPLALAADGVYETYGRVYNLVYALFLPATYALHRLHAGAGTALERRGFKVIITGLLLTFVGVAGDYWADGVGFGFEVLGLLILGVGMSMYGVALRRSNVLPNWCAWLFVLCGPGLAVFMLLIGHIPSGPTFPLALTWLAAGGALLSGRDDTR